MTLIDIQILSPGNCECYHVWQVDSHDKWNFAKKFTVLRWEDSPELLQWSLNVSTSILTRWIQRKFWWQKHREQGDKMQSLEYRGHKPRNAGSHWKPKEEGMVLPQSFQGECTLWYLGFGPVTVWSPEPWENKFLLSVEICYHNHGKVEYILSSSHSLLHWNTWSSQLYNAIRRLHPETCFYFPA